MIFHSLAALLLASVPLAPTAGQTAPEVRCTDDDGTDRCAEAEQRRMRASYGVPSIEEHRARGEEVRRVFYVDGYGRDVVLIAFVRVPGRDPELMVHWPMQAGGTRREPMRAPVPQPVWDETVQRAAHFDRSFDARAEDPSPLCLHASVHVVEAAEPNRFRGHELAVRRKTESACGGGPATLYAQEVQRLAVGLLPHCAALDPERYRNPAMMLSGCYRLHGDRLAAAEVMNRAEPFSEAAGAGGATRIAGLFGHAARIDWAGDRYSGPGYRAGAFWAGKLERTQEGNTLFDIERAEGLTAHRVRLTGSMSRPTDTPQGTATGLETATVEQIWVRDVNGVMAVEQATVGPWVPFRRR
jgi:hypothetical protein